MRQKHVVLMVQDFLAQDLLTTLRIRETEDGGYGKRFYVAALYLSRFLIARATGAFAPRSKDVTIETPLCTTTTNIIVQNDMTFVHVRRAGGVLADAAFGFFPHAHFGAIDLHRDERTLEPIEGPYHNLPESFAGQTVFILDPMLATGGTADWAIKRAKELGATRIVFVGLVSAPRGFDFIRSNHPDVPIVLAARDPILNGVGYIEPGLGDMGDRLYGANHDEYGNPRGVVAAKA
ncbi:MAG: uracil phosphoribosyltransferase [bacterium]|nr:uracil phosphoribosyltransferase [bacterium]